MRDEPFDPARHDYGHFTCDRESLTDYLRKYAEQDQKRGVTKVYVLVTEQNPVHVVGYYTLAAAELHVEHLPQDVAKRPPKYPVPCYRLGRLAVSETKGGQGIGSQLLGSAMKRCLEARKLVASYALVVDALDSRAQEFYVKHGFQPLDHRTLTLWMTLPRRQQRVWTSARSSRLTLT
ncbi:MAG: GNAT family N-acetyltransferase [Steroidobacteraceae bacterium]